MWCIFTDTWGWIALHNKREPRHEEIKAFYQSFRDQKGTVYTTDYVLDETFTLLFRRLPFSQARESLELLEMGGNGLSNPSLLAATKVDRAALEKYLEKYNGEQESEKLLALYEKVLNI